MWSEAFEWKLKSYTKGSLLSVSASVFLLHILGSHVGGWWWWLMAFARLFAGVHFEYDEGF